MNFSFELALEASSKLLCISILIQSFENWSLRFALSKEAAWSRELVAGSFSALHSTIRRLILSLDEGPLYQLILGIQVLCCCLFFIHENAVHLWILLVTTTWIHLRWRGVFNGGSDFMTKIGLLCCGIAFSFSDHRLIASGALLYWGVQVVFSYFFAGLAKLREKAWRSGMALPIFLKHSTQILGRKLALQLQDRPIFSSACCWLVLTFELAFPLILVSKIFCLVMISFAVIFHLGNWAALGLNRFFWAWLASYPALLFSSQWISENL